MRDWERLRKMKDWFTQELCKGREFKVPVPATGQKAIYGPDIRDFSMGEPRVFIGWQPLRPDEPGKLDPSDPFSVCPAITLMPGAGNVRLVEEKSFDRSMGVRRGQDMGQHMNIQALFTIYEPGVRLPGFAAGMDAGNPDMGLIQDGTEEGLRTLLNWMDDAKELILRERGIPGTDLTLDDDHFMASLYTDQQYIVDRRPMFQGFLNIPFRGYASKGNDHYRASRADRLLDGAD